MGGERLRPVAILDTERTVFTLVAQSGEPLLEVADDRVTASILVTAIVAALAGGLWLRLRHRHYERLGTPEPDAAD